MFLDGGAGALPRTRERNAARLAVDYGNLRKRRRRKAIGEVARGLEAVVLIVIPNCYAKAAAESARWRRSLRCQTVGREPARPWCLFLLRMHIEHSSTTPSASNYGAPVFHELTVPGAAPYPPLASFFCTCGRCGVHRCARCATLNQYFQCRCASAADRRITDSQSTAAYQTGGLHGI